MPLELRQRKYRNLDDYLVLYQKVKNYSNNMEICQKTNKQTKQELDLGNHHRSSLGQFEHENKQQKV